MVLDLQEKKVTKHIAGGRDRVAATFKLAAQFIEAAIAVRKSFGGSVKVWSLAAEYNNRPRRYIKLASRLSSRRDASY